MYYMVLKPYLDHHGNGMCSCQGVGSINYTDLLSWLSIRTSKPESHKIEYVNDVILAKQKIRQLKHLVPPE